MYILLIIGFVFLLFAFPFLRCVFFNFPHWFLLTVKDFFISLKNRSFNICPTGKIICFSGLFGFGKTLSSVHHIIRLYKRYNNKWCFVNGSLRLQKILVLSNVELKSIPFIHFTSLSQITDFTQKKSNMDSDKYWFVLLVLGDEFSTCLNSRSFKTNIDPLFLNTLVTCRHYAISLYYTSQRFNLVDKLLRDVTFYVYQCRKIGRVQLLSKYDAFDLENCSNTSLIKPLSRTAFLIRDFDYDSYDTLATVDNLVKTDDFIPESEILSRVATSPDMVHNVHLSRRGKKLFGKK